MMTYKQKISKLLGINQKEIDEIYKEINSSEFIKHIMEKGNIQRGFFDLSMLSVLRAPTIYVLCRVLKPELVLETGVADGFSTSFILYALEKTKKGRLYSIDLPNQRGQELGTNKSTGWLVPNDLRKRWTLILGSSKEKLPTLLNELGKIDIFYHDSDHGYENMLFEFNLSWSFLKDNGVLISDDITDSRAFEEFCSLKKCRNTTLFKLGIMSRRGRE